LSTFTLHLGDCIDVMRTLPDSSVDAIVTDPPYELGFMGKGWDKSGIANSVAVWAEALRVLKPGGHLLAFSGSRTYHRMVVAIEDAGFEVRDQLLWLYGSGMPKSRNIARYDMTGEHATTWDGWGTALKPAHEPICMARKPLAKGMTVAANVLAHGTGALNIEACRIEVADGNATTGRWPANVIHDGSETILAEFAQYGEKGAAAPVHTRGSDKFRNSYGAFKGNVDEGGSTFQGDSGTAARFFYCAKATRTDRNEGCEGMDKRDLNWSSGTQNPGSFQSENTDRSSENHHPTVKPTALMAYLVRLVTPPGGTVLDFFMGSGSTGKACMQEGFDFIGIDMTPEYVAIAEARIRHAQAAQAVPARAPAPQIDLFEDTP
jgi:site-specific DNA-methyltransferase (adenine-specific)